MSILYFKENKLAEYIYVSNIYCQLKSKVRNLFITVDFKYMEDEQCIATAHQY